MAFAALHKIAASIMEVRRCHMVQQADLAEHEHKRVQHPGLQLQGIECERLQTSMGLLAPYRISSSIHHHSLVSYGPPP